MQRLRAVSFKGPDGSTTVVDAKHMKRSQSKALLERWAARG